MAARTISDWQKLLRDKPIKTDRWLRKWLFDFLGLKVPQEPVCPCHRAPLDYLKHVYFEPTRDVVVWAPRGGGKTRLGAAATMLDLLHKHGVQVRILGGSLDQSRRMREHLLIDAEKLAVELTDDAACDRQTVQLKTGSRARVLAQSQKAVRGLRVQKLRCDEVEMFNREVWEAAQLVTQSAGVTRACRTGTMFNGKLESRVMGTVEVLSTWHKPWGVMSGVIENARQQGIEVIQWCILDVLERCGPERSCTGCLLYDECRGVAKVKCDGFFSIDDAIRIKRRVSEETWKSEMLCQKPNVSGCVFPTFNPDIHITRTDTSEQGEMTLAIDFGFKNPFVCLWVCAREDGTTCVLDEYMQEARTVDEHLSEIERRRWGAVKLVACDPAGKGRNDQTAESNVALLRRNGFRVRTRSSLILDGIELIRAGLKTGSGEVSLFIHERCTRLIKALQSYHYGDHGGELPVKDGVHDHLIDALRYYYVNRQGGGKATWRCY